MAGTKAGAAKARDTNMKKYGSDFYATIGAKGGKLGRTGGFYANRDLARKAGKVGGSRSKRGPSVKSDDATVVISDNQDSVTDQTA